MVQSVLTMWLFVPLVKTMSLHASSCYMSSRIRNLAVIIGKQAFANTVAQVKESTSSAGDGLGKSPGEGNGNPLQYSCLENPMDRGAW